MKRLFVVIFLAGCVTLPARVAPPRECNYCGAMTQAEPCSVCGIENERTTRTTPSVAEYNAAMDIARGKAKEAPGTFIPVERGKGPGWVQAWRKLNRLQTTRIYVVGKEVVDSEAYAIEFASHNASEYLGAMILKVAREASPSLSQEETIYLSGGQDISNFTRTLMAYEAERNRSRWAYESYVLYVCPADSAEKEFRRLGCANPAECVERLRVELDAKK
ncbi:hypothetical protein HY625_03040 [Candidatus Uhrbacteria bacterium]|nr:hypothetical protein [Candidatus Uhrbacteria bacterium]